jgi:hypothetical protein
MITPEISHSINRSTFCQELFDDSELDHRDIALSEEKFLDKEMDSMTCFHQGFEELHDITLGYSWFFLEEHSILALNSLGIKQFLQDVFISSEFTILLRLILLVAKVSKTIQGTKTRYRPSSRKYFFHAAQTVLRYAIQAYLRLKIYFRSSRIIRIFL